MRSASSSKTTDKIEDTEAENQLSCLVYSGALVLFVIQTKDLPFSFTGTHGARRYHHSGVQLPKDWIEDAEMRSAISRILKVGCEERMRLCKLGKLSAGGRSGQEERMESVCNETSKISHDFAKIEHIEDQLGEDREEPLHTPQTCPDQATYADRKSPRNRRLIQSH
ncbi:hypothetical protein BLNAU_23187 [Blattamonas nauphoetae]|uniref:Uncharacterized protein n=1 Tax=Blattamonas nauphoetae TaxID=2049346 RepID=A0ABQ9WQX9_9EUKA|nr:hypothetical protein BLNAU_23187 [Blattamonas nauphoetae]